MGIFQRAHDIAQAKANNARQPAGPHLHVPQVVRSPRKPSGILAWMTAQRSVQEGNFDPAKNDFYAQGDRGRHLGAPPNVS